MKNTADCPFEEKKCFCCCGPLMQYAYHTHTHRIQIEALDDKMNELKNNVFIFKEVDWLVFAYYYTLLYYK